MITIITRYDYELKPRPKVVFDVKDPLSRSVTNQSDKDGADINKIMERYEKTGLLPDFGRTPCYGDFSGILDYHALQNTLAKASEAFDLLPAGIRFRFGNDPANLIDFLHNTDNDEEAVKLGLKDASVLKKPEQAQPVPPATAGNTATPVPPVVA